MILALVEKGKKRMAYAMLALIYFETVIPSWALGAPRTVYNSNVVRRYDPVKKNKPLNIIPPHTVKLPAAAPHVKAAPSAPKKTEDIGGPTQPESQAFHSVNSDNMVDLFTGDFNYSLPLLDVGGYPVAIGYSSGISMDQEASWVGLGWNLNPGAITRNLRGLPDDFNGQDTVTKTVSVKENKTIGATAGVNWELAGVPLNLSASLGVLHNSYRGWGMESGISASLNAGGSGSGDLTGGLSLGLTSSSQDGLTISPSLSVGLNEKYAKEKGGFAGSASTSLGYNTRSGMKALQFSAGITQYRQTEQNTQGANTQAEEKKSDGSTPSEQQSRAPRSAGAVLSGHISFASPSFMPSMTMPYTSNNYTVTLTTGGQTKIVHPGLSISGYISKQYIADEDKVLRLPAYGYLNYQNGTAKTSALLDYNREREIPYREKPAIPNIAIPSYTYDVFSMTGEGTGGVFRAYRSDVGYVYDHRMSTRDKSASLGIDFGAGDLANVGVDPNFTTANTTNGPWTGLNPMGRTIAFTESDKDYEAVYFRNPAEGTINTRDFYDAIGGDHVVNPKLYKSGSSIGTTNILTETANGQKVGEIPVTPASVIKHNRDKRTQLVTSLNAQEAGLAGLSQYIENYVRNEYPLNNCNNISPLDEWGADGTGLWAEIYNDPYFQSFMFARPGYHLYWGNADELTNDRPREPWFTFKNWFAIRWTGYLKAPATGAYTFYATADDGARVTIEDLVILDVLSEDKNHNHHDVTSQTVYLEKDHFYHFKVEYNQYGGESVGCYFNLSWTYPNQAKEYVPERLMYPRGPVDTFAANNEHTLFKEQRVNSFRKSNHMSEVSVTNSDGKKYIYGIPVYNLKQKEVTFSAKHERGNVESGMVGYTSRLTDKFNADDSISNKNGTDNYFTSEETPAYAHSFLLTGVTSPDYVDVTGDGITDDDLGNAVKFNYTKMAGQHNPYEWRTPYSDSASYNEGLRSDTRDDKGSYVYGQKELWYLNSIESKNMIATFKLGDRRDLAPIDEKGRKDTNYHLAQRLEEINLYTKADFKKNGASATPVKTVHFDYSYELCKGVNGAASSTGKLTLKRIWFTYNGNNKGRKNPYMFRYNPNNPAYNTKSYDRWGNYKDALQNPGSSAGHLVTNAEYPYALQDSAVAARNAAAWTLDTIILPSGGRMAITYESDDYAYVQNRRAAQMMNVVGFSKGVPGSTSDLSDKLYSSSDDNLYIGIRVPEPVSSKEEVYYKYLERMDTMYFRLNVKMPSDKFGSGNEYVSGYAHLAPGEYGMVDNNTIWVKVQGINNKGETGGSNSPMVKTALQFLRLNLPSKAYPGSDVGDNLDLVDAVKIIFSMAANIKEVVTSFEGRAKGSGWAKTVDLSRTFVRLDNPAYKKLGGGLRVKRIVINDNWNAMTGKTQKESTYGTEYIYTTIKKINNKDKEISSGVAAWEPILGGEENPWHLPLEYNEQVAALAPTNLGYVELPLGESFFPGASVGYSKVRTRSIKTKNTRSANGFEETTFYTAYDFPTFTDHSLLDETTKLTYKPTLLNLLQINAAHYLVMSQGFKVELNDMHGKPRAHAVYPEGDSVSPISYTENYYHVDDVNDPVKHLNNTVLSMNAKGEIDTTALIGKDMELMMDMRQQRSTSFGMGCNLNAEIFTFGLPPVLGWPSFVARPQSEENLFRSAAATKVISRHGILDSVVAIDKGSKVVTCNLLYDGETGEPVLTAVQNEFGDSVYQFSYPAAWVYDGMSGAYKNTGFSTDSVNIKNGKVMSGLSQDEVNQYFASGDEIAAYSRNSVEDKDCDPQLATFRSTARIWAVDANATKGGPADIYFMDRNGKPYTGMDLILKTMHSGRKNIAASVGGVTMLVNPLKRDANGKYNLVINKDSKIISAGVTEFKQNWQVDDKKKSIISCSF